MAAYQCLHCNQIERGEEDCCDKPDLFCINDMAEEILRLRAAIAAPVAQPPAAAPQQAPAAKKEI